MDPHEKDTFFSVVWKKYNGNGLSWHDDATGINWKSVPSIEVGITTPTKKEMY